MNVGVAVPGAVPMHWVVLPAVPYVVYPVVVVDVEVAIAPVESNAPIIAPASNRPASAKCQTSRDQTRADIGRRSEIVRRGFVITTLPLYGGRLLLSAGRPDQR